MSSCCFALMDCSTNPDDPRNFARFRAWLEAQGRPPFAQLWTFQASCVFRQDFVQWDPAMGKCALFRRPENIDGVSVFDAGINISCFLNRSISFLIS